MADAPTRFQRLFPNLLTALRIVLALPCALLVWSDALWAGPAALALFLFAASLDWFDGVLARRWNVISDFGRALDPVADKVLVISVLLGLAADGVLGWMIVPALVIVARDFTVCGLREFAGANRRTLHVSKLAKWKTASELAALALLLAVPAFGAALGTMAPLLYRAGAGLLWIAAWLSAWTGFVYALAVLRTESATPPSVDE